MQWLLGFVVVVLMFLLRFAVPVAITFAVGYGLHRLDVRWHPSTTDVI